MLERNRALAARMARRGRAARKTTRTWPRSARRGMILAIEVMKRRGAIATPWPFEQWRGLRIYRLALEARR